MVRGADFKIKTQYDNVRKAIRADTATEKSKDRLMMSLFWNVAMKEIPEFLMLLEANKVTKRLDVNKMICGAIDVCGSAEKYLRSRSYLASASPIHKDDVRDREQIESIFDYMEKTILDCTVSGGRLDINCVDSQLEQLLKTLEEIDFHGNKRNIKNFVDDVRIFGSKAKSREEKLIALLLGASLYHYLKRFYSVFLKPVG